MFFNTNQFMCIVLSIFIYLYCKNPVTFTTSVIFEIFSTLPGFKCIFNVSFILLILRDTDFMGFKKKPIIIRDFILFMLKLQVMKNFVVYYR